MELKEYLSTRPLRVAAVIALLCVAALALYVLSAPSATAPAQLWHGDEFSLRGVEKRTVGRALVIPTRENAATRLGASVAVIEGLKLPATAYPALFVRFAERDRNHKIALIWRNDREPLVTQRMELAPSESLDELVNVASHRGWAGNISGVGMMAAHTRNAPLIATSVEALPTSPVVRLRMLSGSAQVALSRPVPGQEAVVQATSLRIALWLAFAAAAFVAVLATVLASRTSAKAMAVMALACTLMLVGAGGALSIADISRDAGLFKSSVRPETLRALNDAMRGTASTATARTFVFSGHERGHELALASPAQINVVRVADQPLPQRAELSAGDIIVVLARRGVRFVPTARTIEWQSGDAAVRVPATLLWADGGDAIFRVS